MKKSIVFAAGMLFAVVGFSQTAEKHCDKTADKANCAKAEGKPACCAHASEKSCHDQAAKVDQKPGASATAQVAAQPKREEKAVREEPAK